MRAMGFRPDRPEAYQKHHRPIRRGSATGSTPVVNTYTG
jgi:hypothetical protein